MNARGFTLLETMIVVVVAGLVLTFGVPAFATYRQTMLLRETRSQLLDDLRSARQLAVTRRAQVYVVFGTPPTTTNITSYKIHVDMNGDRLVNGADTRKTRTFPSGIKLDNVALTPVDTLNFDISGILYPGGTGGFLIFSNSRNRRDTLLVSAAGMVYRP